ncbi:MAG: glycosyltransferase family 9 protein, partial [Candidatus Latescibacteria bacterium]|nr:glycosyltransferase family 9 protein [Candidatus Latescibacterota bacterium]
MRFGKILERLGKSCFVTLLSPFVRTNRFDKTTFHQSKVERILIVRKDRRLGNLLLLTPLIEVLRRSFPTAYIACLVDETCADLLRGDPRVNALITIRSDRLFWNPFALRRLLKHLSLERFDLAIDTSHMHSFSLGSALLTYGTKAKFRLGYDRGKSHRFLTLCIPPTDHDIHESDIHLNLLRSIVGEIYPTPPMRIFLDNDGRLFARKYLAIKGITADTVVVGLHIGGHGSKQLPPRFLLTLIDALHAEPDVKLVLFYGTDDVFMLRQIEQRIRESSVTYIEPLPLRQFAALVEQCDLFVVGDTGPMHLSVAVGTPTIAIFLVKNYRRYGPQGERHRIVYSEARNVTGEDVMVAYRDLREHLQAIKE